MNATLNGIILVEDDDGHALLVEKNLRRAGMVSPLLRLRDGEEALDYFFAGSGGRPAHSTFSHPVVLLDVNMPKIDGVEVLRQLKTDPATAMLPIIMLTTTDDPREIARCYEFGCNIYVTKPVVYGAFVEAVQRLGCFLQVVQLPQSGKEGSR